MYIYIYILALTPSNNWMGACGLLALVDPIARNAFQHVWSQVRSQIWSQFRADKKEAGASGAFKSSPGASGGLKSSPGASGGVKSSLGALFCICFTVKIFISA